MSDYYNDGFNDGYGRRQYGPREYPQTDSDRYSYERGREDGERRRRISRELDDEQGGGK